MRTILMGFAVCAGFVALRSDASAATITLTSDPAVGVGQTTIVELVVDDLGATAMAPSVGAYDITISFDANLLGFVGVAFGDPVLGNQLDLSGLGSIHGDDPGVGGVDVFEVSLDLPGVLNSQQAAAFVLARLTLIGLSEGTSALGVVVNALSDADGLALPAVATSGSIDVVAVPEPAVLIYFATGAALVGLRRHHHNRTPRRRTS